MYASCEKYRSKLLVDPTVAVKELLCGLKWRLMQLLRTFHQAEAGAKLFVKRIGVITHHFEPAAFRGALRAKGAHNDVTARLNAACHLSDVSNPLLSCSKEMEHCAIMPEVVRAWVELGFRDVGDKPVHPLRGRTQSPLRKVDCGLRDIEDSDVFVSAMQTIVNEC